MDPAGSRSASHNLVSKQKLQRNNGIVFLKMRKKAVYEPERKRIVSMLLFLSVICLTHG